MSIQQAILFGEWNIPTIESFHEDHFNPNDKKEKTLLDGRKPHGRMWNVHLGYCKASGSYWQVLWRCGMRYVFRTWLLHALSCTT